MNQSNLKTLSLIIIASMFLSNSIAHAETVWVDTFNDKEADGWEMEILDWDLSDPFTEEAVEYDTSAGTLKAPGDTPGNIWYLATRESNLDYGTWMFDVNIVDTDWEHFYVFFMTDDWADYPSKAYSYDLIFITGPGDPEPDSKGGIVLFKRNGYRGKWDSIGEWGSTEEIVGWHHIIVTRDPDGVFDVYLDDELIMHVEDDEPESGMFSTFRFTSASGPEIDNVVLLDTFDIEIARDYEFEPEFELSNLRIEPDSVTEGESVTVSVECSNIGGVAGTHTVVLKIDGQDEDEETVSLDVEESTEISFEVPSTQSGTYSVDVNGLTGSFEVKKAQTGIPGFPVESIIAGLAVVLFVLWFNQRTS